MGVAKAARQMAYVMAFVAVAVAACCVGGPVGSEAREQEGGLDRVSVEQLTERGTSYWPSSSPDGERIAFLERRSQPSKDGPGTCELRVMDADGSHGRRLWEGKLPCGHGEEGLEPAPRPSWSFDGHYLSVTDGSLSRSSTIVGSRGGADYSAQGVFDGIGALALFSPRRPLVAYLRIDVREGWRAVHVRDIGGGQDHVLAEGEYGQPPEGYVHPLAWSRSGEVLRVPETRLHGQILGRFVYSFYALSTRELLLRTVNSQGDPLVLGEGSTADRTVSESGRWQVVSPIVEQVHSPQLGAHRFGTSLVVARRTADGIGEPVFTLSPLDRRRVLSYQWGQRGDVLVFALGVEPQPPGRAPERWLTRADRESDIFRAVFR